MKRYNNPRFPMKILILAFASLVSASLADPTSEPRIPLGANLGSLGRSDAFRTEGWRSGQAVEVGVFLDLMLHRTPFYRLYCQGSPSQIDFDKCMETRYIFATQGSESNTACLNNALYGGACDTYPSSLARGPNRFDMAVTHIGAGGAHVPGGEYVLLYEGEADIIVRGDAAALVDHPNSGPGRLYFNVTPADGVDIIVAWTNSSNSIRSMHAVPVWAENTFKEQPFHPDFLDQLADFSVLRFAGWQKTLLPYGAPSTLLPRRWDLRTLPTEPQHRQFARRYQPLHDQLGRAPVHSEMEDGVAIEYMVKLSNLLEAAPWFCMPKPGGDNDDYITRFAQLVAETLNPNLPVYVEYCNGELYTGWDRLATRRVHSIFETAFNFTAETPESNQLVRVLSMSYVPHVLEHFGAELVHIDAVALRAVFGTRTSEVKGAMAPFSSLQYSVLRPNMTADEVVETLRQNVYEAEREVGCTAIA